MPVHENIEEDVQLTAHYPQLVLMQKQEVRHGREAWPSDDAKSVADRLPFPHTSTIAKRMGLPLRAVQDTVNSLKKKGLIDKVRERRKDAVRYVLAQEGR
jgi:hypothetical protein